MKLPHRNGCASKVSGINLNPSVKVEFDQIAQLLVKVQSLSFLRIRRLQFL